MQQNNLVTNKTNSAVSLWVALIIYWFLTGILLIASLRTSQGHFGYPLDDTYIHMSMAKNFASGRAWGVAQNGFSSSTSSPLWTWLIAVSYRLFGVTIWSPFVLSLLFGSLILYVCYRLLRNNTNTLRLALLLILISFIVPLPIIALTGMEHALQGFFALLLIYFSADFLAKNHFDFYSYATLVVLANLATITRYESILLVVSITLLFLIKKRFWEGLFFGASSLFSVTIYGFISLSQGWYFLPNSILLKGNTPSATVKGITAFLWKMIDNFYYSPHVTVLLIGCLVSYLVLKNQLDEKEKLLILLATIMTFAHMQFAGVGWFFRYEAYIVLILSVVLTDVLSKYIFPQLAQMKNGNLYDYTIMISLVFLFLLTLTTRTGLAFNQYPKAVNNIYEQQYQMGLFLQKYYEGECVAANDIGAINYLATICTIDLTGLASMQVAEYRLGESYTANEIDHLISENNVPVAIIYNSWFEGKIPADWIEVGKWKISDNVVAGSDEISFYAPTMSSKQSLINNLIEFSKVLPATVEQSGIYVSP